MPTEPALTAPTHAHVTASRDGAEPCLPGAGDLAAPGRSRAIRAADRLPNRGLSAQDRSSATDVSAVTKTKLRLAPGTERTRPAGPARPAAVAAGVTVAGLTFVRLTDAAVAAAALRRPTAKTGA
jgi:hypothetical protein